MVASPLTYKGRLPGVLCEPALPRQTQNPLRLDVAGLVGFAERGPLDTPIMIEDISQYRAIFGRDLLIARDGGRPIYAYLPGTVQAFFNNGGRRCYVVRVAGEGARPNQFQMPGMVTFDGTNYARVNAPAAWVGRWSNTMRVGTQIRSLPLRLPDRPVNYRRLPGGEVSVDLEIPATSTIQPGDVVCLQFDDARESRLMFRADDVVVTNTVPETQHNIPVTVTGRAESMQVFAAVLDLAAAPPQVRRLTENGWRSIGTGLSAIVAVPGGYQVDLAESNPVAVGDILRLRYPTHNIIFPVNAVDWAYEGTTETRYQQVFSRYPLQVSRLSAIAGQPQQADRLRFDLTIQEGDLTLEVWENLSFGTWTDQLADTTVLSASDLSSRSMRLSAPVDAAAMNFFPLGMDELPLFAGPMPEESVTTGKDGLDTFDPNALFLDPQFAGYGWRSIMSRADDLLYRSDPPQKLVRLHSLLPVEEVALLAVPDLAHRPWLWPEPLDIEEPDDEPEPPPEPDWSQFQDCPIEPEPEAETGPLLEPIELSSLGGGASGPINFTEQLAAVPVLVADDAYSAPDMDALIAVQEAMINLCAARADMVTVLSMPQHFVRREVVDWHSQLTGIPAFRDGSPLSYAAAYHGWIQLREEVSPQVEPLRNLPPDGTICGMIAVRELARGPWVAPANETLRDVVGLTPEMDEADWEVLFNQQINLIQQEPGRFVLMSAHTLSDDRLFLQVSVRRLLIFLRKMVLRQGAQYVFESNNERFRRLVQVGFERRMNALLENGALTAFRVVTGSEVNTLQDRDQGRFIIELRIAPSQPIEFITLVLLRSGETVLEIIER